MLHLVVEGEPGIFPQPVAGVLRRLGGWAERLLTRRGRAAEGTPPEAPPPAGDEADR